MLVLSRRIGESLLLGDDIEIRILGINGSQVRVAIKAPADVHIVRKELLRRDALKLAAESSPAR